MPRISQPSTTATGFQSQIVGGPSSVCANQASILVRWPRSVADQAWLDPFATRMSDLSRSLLRSPRLDDAARGSWLGHPVHPALTDLPIGFWTSAMAVDFLGGPGADT